MTATFVALLLLGLVVLVAIAVAWQERNQPAEPVVVYSVEDALEFVWEHLSPPTRAQLRRSDVRRILEWEMYYFQRARPVSGAQPAVVGSIEAAAYVQERALARDHAYEPPVLFEVLDRQADYLESIGAVGGRAFDADGGLEM